MEGSTFEGKPCFIVVSGLRPGLSDLAMIDLKVLSNGVPLNFYLSEHNEVTTLRSDDEDLLIQQNDIHTRLDYF